MKQAVAICRLASEACVAAGGRRCENQGQDHHRSTVKRDVHDIGKEMIVTVVLCVPAS
jgi:cobalamin-dependent methionine synthase I